MWPNHLIYARSSRSISHTLLLCDLVPYVGSENCVAGEKSGIGRRVSHKLHISLPNPD